MKLNRMQVLSPEEVRNIADASRRILAERGVKIDSEKVLKLLEDRGAAVDLSEGTVRFSEELQERCLSTVPRRIPVVDRNGESAFVIGESGPAFASGHNAVFLDDYETKSLRRFTLDDIGIYTRVSHQLKEIDFVSLAGSPSGVNERYSLLHSLKATMENTTKPLYFSTESARINHYGIEMALRSAPDASGKGAYLISQLSPTSPLFWERGAVEGVVECAERGIAVSILPEPITGMSAPYSLAGLITVHNAEALSGVFITQLVNPGSPVIWGSSWTTFDMKRSCSLVGSIETTLCRIGGAQVAKYYGLPLHTTAPNSDDHGREDQNCWEKTYSLFCAAASGNDIIVNLGMYACGMTISFEQLVLDAEIVGQAKRLLSGIDASPAMIAEDLIKEIGYRGSYIMAEHTLELLHSAEHRSPLVATREGYAIWKDSGCKTSETLAHDLVTDLMHRPVLGLSSSTRVALDDCILEAERE